MGTYSATLGSMSKNAEPKVIPAVIKCAECGVTFASQSEDQRRRWAERHIQSHFGTRKH